MRVIIFRRSTRPNILSLMSLGGESRGHLQTPGRVQANWEQLGSTRNCGRISNTDRALSSMATAVASFFTHCGNDSSRDFDGR